ncbi:c-type cytochrome biogenesis protein CcmI [Roseomonas sp. GC11]|uniref:c-type cytochrome biogenesis protein CcmI n=1 Tax=Roseomonas sp. GC11 TaxID=2950546 RepID=UPI002108D3C8|nr:c-type cytochrome biogenesis protein CcmI [Roseomonas sp. GC11]MCQ4160945.1 c-type cytochrome biogenesis protein CcmI [Roseomonas sp. GC11]
MIWLLFLALAVLALAPLGWSLLRPPRLTGRREADLALYRAQLAELEREREAGRLEPEAHRAAVLEVQRRLLAMPEGATAALPGRPPGRGAAVLGALLFLLPAFGVGLYLWHGEPDIPAAPYAERAAAAARDEALLTRLRERLSQGPQDSEVTRQGWVLLGNAERGRGHLERAAEAWQRALDTRFEGPLAAELAEMQIERGRLEDAENLVRRAMEIDPAEPRLRYLRGLVQARGGRSEEARASWRSLLADAPADAPWRGLVERRLQELP